MGAGSALAPGLVADAFFDGVERNDRLNGRKVV